MLGSHVNLFVSRLEEDAVCKVALPLVRRTTTDSSTLGNSAFGDGMAAIVKLSGDI